MGRGRFWTESELAFLGENIDTMSVKEIAEKLNRTTISISQRAFRLRLLARNPKPKQPPLNPYCGVSFRKALPADRHGDMLMFLAAINHLPANRKASIDMRHLPAAFKAFKEGVIYG